MINILCTDGCKFLVVDGQELRECGKPKTTDGTNFYEFCQEHTLYLGSISGREIIREQLDLFETNK